MQKNEEEESPDIEPFSESASSPEKDDTPVEAGSAGGAPVDGADAESNIEKPQPSLAEIERILDGSEDATNSKIREILGTSGRDVVQQKAALLRALDRLAEDMRREKQIVAKTERILEIFDEFVQIDGTNARYMAESIARAPTELQPRLLTGMLQGAQLPMNQISSLVKSSLGNTQEGLSAPQPPASSTILAESAPPPPESYKSVTTPPRSPWRSPSGDALAPAPVSPSGPEELAAAQVNWEETAAREAAAREAAAVAVTAAAAAEAAAEEAAAVESERLAFEVTRDLVKPVPVELQTKLEFDGKSPDERERLMKLAAGIIGFPALEVSNLDAAKQEISAAFFSTSSRLPSPTAAELALVKTAASIEQLSKGPLAGSAGVKRGLLVLAAKDNQFFEVVTSAAGTDPKLTGLVGDLRRMRKKDTGLIGKRVFEKVGKGTDASTIADGEQCWKNLRSLTSHWGLLHATVFTVVRDTVDIVARAYSIFDSVGFVTNSTQLKEILRMLFGEETSKESDLYKQLGVKLLASSTTWSEMSLTDDEHKEKLFQRAKEAPKKKRSNLESDTPGVTTGRLPADPSELATLKARVKTLEAQTQAQNKGGAGGGGKTTIRAAAATVTSGAAAAVGSSSVEEFCKFCEVAGHSVSDCTVVKFVAGSGGAEVLRWAQCWRCNNFGHVKQRCPTPAPASSSPRLNGSASPTVGGGLTR